MRHELIYAVIRQIPPGQVASYGQVAAIAGSPGSARQIGYALAALSDSSGVPWHRVLNARGMISPRPGGAPVTQRLRLEREGVQFSQDGRVNLLEYGWKPEGNELSVRDV